MPQPAGPGPVSLPTSPSPHDASCPPPSKARAPDGGDQDHGSRQTQVSTSSDRLLFLYFTEFLSTHELLACLPAPSGLKAACGGSRRKLAQIG
eukprot:5624408-Prymnesium_polylepis.1